MILGDRNESKSKRERMIKIIVPVLIICVIVVLWVVKNTQQDTELEQAGDSEFALQATEALDLDALKSYGLPILIEFGSDSCAPCRQMAPIIEALHQELEGKAIIKYVDVWENPDFADGYPISVIPTQLFIDAEGEPYNPANPDSPKMDLYVTKDTGEHVFTTHEGTLTKEELLSIFKEMGMQ